MKFHFAFIFLLIAQVSLSQDWKWGKSAHSYGGGAEGWPVSADDSGNVVITGFFWGPAITFGNITLNNIDPGGTTTDIYIAKYDSSGNLLWAKRAGGMGNDLATSVTTDDSGNVLVCGTFGDSSMVFPAITLISAGYLDGFLAKYDAAGNFRWAKRIGGIVYDNAVSVSTNTAGDVFVCGNYGDSISFGSFILSPYSNLGNYFIAKCDAGGNWLWARGAGGWSTAVAVSADAFGNAYVSGTFQDSVMTIGSTTLHFYGSANTFLAKYDASGNVRWARGARNNPYNLVYSMSCDGAANVYIAGSFASDTLVFGTDTVRNVTNGPWCFIAKYDSSGNALWAKSTGGSQGGDFAFSISSTAAGDFYVTGSFGSTSINFGSFSIDMVPGPDPIFIAHYDSAGNAMCAVGLPSGGDDNDAISVDRFGNAYLCGDFRYIPMVFGSDTINPTGEEDVFLAKLKCDRMHPNTDPDSSTCHDIFVPSAFSPNGDGQNEILFVRSQCIRTLDFQVYDRLGEKVFETADINQGWDGSLLGEKMNAAVFVYILSGTFHDGTAFSQKGDVALIK